MGPKTGAENYDQERIFRDVL